MAETTARKTLYHILRQHGTVDPISYRVVGTQEAYGAEQALKQQFPGGCGEDLVAAVADSSWRPGKLLVKPREPILGFEAASAPADRPVAEPV